MTVASPRKLKFADLSPALQPIEQATNDRQAYYVLANIDEFPECQPLAFDIVEKSLANSVPLEQRFPDLTTLNDVDGQFSQLTDLSNRNSGEQQRPWKSRSDADSKRIAMAYFSQFLPTALLNGCWLQCAMRVSSAHTDTGAIFSRLFNQIIRVLPQQTVRNPRSAYRNLSGRLTKAPDDISTRSFSESALFQDFAFPLPVFLQSIGQYPQSFTPELLGVHFAWSALGISAFLEDLLFDVAEIHSLAVAADREKLAVVREQGRHLAETELRRFLKSQAEDIQINTWRRACSGIAVVAGLWEEWLSACDNYVNLVPADPHQKMIELLCSKAPDAVGYHGSKRLGDALIDDQLSADNLNPTTFLQNLADSRFVIPGKPERSALVNSLVNFGGSMHAVFSAEELQTIHGWIHSLANPNERARVEPVDTTDNVTARQRHRAWTKATFRARSEHRFANCGVRDLYYHLVNVEHFPDILPVAENYARLRLERSMATLDKGIRPIPSLHYDPKALTDWVHTKHREQVDSYRPMIGKPSVSKQSFVEGTIQLAPLILIDGGWLQNVLMPRVIQTPIGKMLYRILFEELGEGDPSAHHANVYRDLLTAMGEDAPPVNSREFAHWPRLLDASFEVPVLWLSISCFPRHFMPEILGLNLAVEIAGIGGPYLEARDTLKYFKLPSLFVELHNAADNVSNGHAAQSLNAILIYMDEIASRDGPHSLDETWQRVWSGVSSTIPQIGPLRLFTHRLRSRLAGRAYQSAPKIFQV